MSSNCYDCKERYFPHPELSCSPWYRVTDEKLSEHVRYIYKEVQLMDEDLKNRGHGCKFFRSWRL